MGACYSVDLKVNVLDVPGAIKALNEHMINDTRSDYSLEEYAEQGITTETFDGVVKVLFAELQQPVFIYQKGKFTVYTNAFNASYGWESIMMEWFKVLTPFVANGSQLLIYPDEGYDKLVVKNGKCVQIH